MKLDATRPANIAPLITLFKETFAASEGEESGAQIEAFVTELLDTTPGDDLFIFTASEGDTLLGTITFSRMNYSEDSRTVFIMSPVAVLTNRQSKGIGQKLISFALGHLKASGVDYVLTYGSPDYYGKTGFQPINEAFAAAPLPLSFPHGWLGQPLNGDTTPLKGTATCVPALNQPTLW